MNFTDTVHRQGSTGQGGGYGDIVAQRSGARAAAAGRMDPKTATRESLRSVSKEFEAIFLNQMISAMRRTVGDGGLVKKSNGQEIFEGMLDEEWSRKMAGQHGSRGLADILYQQLSRQMGLEEDGPAVAGSTPGPGLSLMPQGTTAIALPETTGEGGAE